MIHSQRKLGNRRNLGKYNIVYRPKDPDSFKSGKNVGYKYEHRVVAEEMLHRHLNSDEVVHHLDFNKRNNSPDNLVVLTNAEHAKFHTYIRSHPEIEMPSELPKDPIARSKAIVKMCQHEKPKCIKCGKEVQYEGKLCRECSIADQYDKITPELRDAIKREVELSSISSVARRAGVTFHAVRKWCSGESEFIRKGTHIAEKDTFVPKPVVFTEERRRKMSELAKERLSDKPSPYDVPVVNLDLDRNLIGEYRSAREAQRVTGIPNSAINACCQGKRLTYDGQMWMYKKDFTGIGIVDITPIGFDYAGIESIVQI